MRSKAHAHILALLLLASHCGWLASVGFCWLAIVIGFCWLASVGLC